VRIIAVAVGRRMAELDPGNAALYEDGLAAFLTKWDTAIVRWEERAAPLQGRRVITHHNSWVYLERWLGLEEVANLEPVPGLPPTVSHLSELLSKFGDGGADFIVRSTYQDDKSSHWLSERSGIPAIMLPLTVGGSDEATDLVSLFDDIIGRLLGAVDQ
jgi:zinc/manganese transport system substrate-binding protein